METSVNTNDETPTQASELVVDVELRQSQVA
jgi:hypothetical protein